MKIVEANEGFKSEGYSQAVEIDRLDIAGLESVMNDEVVDDIIFFARSKGGQNIIQNVPGLGELILVQINEKQYLFPVEGLGDGLEDFF